MHAGLGRFHKAHSVTTVQPVDLPRILGGEDTVYADFRNEVTYLRQLSRCLSGVLCIRVFPLQATVNDSQGSSSVFPLSKLFSDNGVSTRTGGDGANIYRSGKHAWYVQK